MTRHDLLEILAVERHTPSPRPPRTSSRCDPPAPVTAEQAERNRAILAAALGTDLHVVQWAEGAA